MHSNSTFYSAPFIMLLALVLSACAPVGTKVSDSALSADVSGLVLDNSELPKRIYRNPQSPPLATYQRFIIDPVQVNYTDPKMEELDPELVMEMQQYFQAAMVKELRQGDYVVGTRSEANTMRIRLTIAGLKAPSAAANVTAVVAPISVSVGEITFQAEFLDALTNGLNAVVIEGARGPRGLNTSPWSTKKDITDALDRWAKGFRETLDKAHKR